MTFVSGDPARRRGPLRPASPCRRGQRRSDGRRERYGGETRTPARISVAGRRPTRHGRCGVCREATRPPGRPHTSPTRSQCAAPSKEVIGDLVEVEWRSSSSAPCSGEPGDRQLLAHRCRSRLRPTGTHLYMQLRGGGPTKAEGMSSGRVSACRSRPRPAHAAKSSTSVGSPRAARYASKPSGA
jgi:hypothetical protein